MVTVAIGGTEGASSAGPLPSRRRHRWASVLGVVRADAGPLRSAQYAPARLPATELPRYTLPLGRRRRRIENAKNGRTDDGVLA